MTMDEPPYEIAPLFLTERERLTELLAGLDPADWWAWASARSMARSFHASAPGRLTSTMSCLAPSRVRATPAEPAWTCTSDGRQSRTVVNRSSRMPSATFSAAVPERACCARRSHRLAWKPAQARVIRSWHRW